MKKYAILEFLDKDISIVPSCWLSDNKKSCFWPVKKFASHQIKCTIPQRNWEEHEVVKIIGYSSRLTYLFIICFILLVCQS